MPRENVEELLYVPELDIKRDMKLSLERQRLIETTKAFLKPFHDAGILHDSPEQEVAVQDETEGSN